MNIDKLYENVAQKGHVCVGLDTSIDLLPPSKTKLTSDKDKARAIFAFNKSIVNATYKIAACYKIQIACYEELGIEGLKCYRDTLKYVQKKECLCIADIKRGDIADTASRYAKAHFSGEFEADFVTINPYMGMDSIEPWLKEAQAKGKGAFVLMRTSNPGMKDFQYCETEGQKLYNVVGNKMTELMQKNKGKKGYGMFGVVVGCTEKEEAEQIRETYDKLFFLIPGYGTQGGTADDVALLLDNDGNGGVVNASRSILSAWKTEKLDKPDNPAAARAAKRAVIAMEKEIKKAIKNKAKNRNRKKK